MTYCAHTRLYVGLVALLLTGACGSQRVAIESFPDGTPIAQTRPGASVSTGPSVSGLYARLAAPYSKDPAEGWRLIIGQSDQVCQQAGDPLPSGMLTAVFYLQQGGILRPPASGRYAVVASLDALTQHPQDGGIALVNLGGAGGRLTALQGGQILLQTVETSGTVLVKGTLQVSALSGDFSTSSCK